ncbi:MAG: LCP family protein [Culicoidibacterales bacterium]
MEQYENDFDLNEYLRSRSMTEHARYESDDDYYYDDDRVDEYPTKRNINRKPQKMKKQKRKKRSFWKIIWWIILVLLVVVIAIGASQFQTLQRIWETFDSTAFTTTQSKKSDAKGILVIGTDLTGSAENLNGYADSITYFGINTTARKTASLPIYRDARIPVTCNNKQLDNINRITKKFNITCLAESTSSMLNLPIDYYVAITIDGVQTVVDKIGGIDITPTETFTSEYGRDNKIHSFTKGVKQHMDGPTVVAYLRDRQHGNGEGRANRQLSAIQAVKSACTTDILKCYNDVLPSVSKMMRTNIPVDKITMLSAIGDKSYDAKAFSVISGQNTQLQDGWSQIVDEDDRKTKTDYFRNNIFA